jgi:hypothetical protein
MVVSSPSSSFLFFHFVFLDPFLQANEGMPNENEEATRCKEWLVLVEFVVEPKLPHRRREQRAQDSTSAFLLNCHWSRNPPERWMTPA